MTRARARSMSSPIRVMKQTNALHARGVLILNSRSRWKTILGKVSYLWGETKLAPSGDGANSNQALLAFLAIAAISASVALAVVALAAVALAIAVTLTVFCGHKVLPLKFRALLLIDHVFLLTIIP